MVWTWQLALSREDEEKFNQRSEARNCIAKGGLIMVSLFFSKQHNFSEEKATGRILGDAAYPTTTVSLSYCESVRTAGQATDSSTVSS
ncbi:hypothetical protein AFLA_012466 [Aspergillus flavus NRRL3357]|nr:hypothetical protein AFLA_012466 [Aspergillus flavus NRRL3357]